MQRIAAAAEQFLAEHSGSLTDISASRRYNHQNPRPPGDGFLNCITVRAKFANRGIFGSSGPFLSEVYPRYRYLRRRLAEHLMHEPLPAHLSESTVAISLVPSVADKTYDGDALPKDSEPTRGASILDIHTLTRHSEYYRRLAGRFAIEHCLLTNKGTVVGPDAGILTTAFAAAGIFEGAIRVIELGTGAGTTASLLAERGKLASYFGNDFSPEVSRFFETVVRPRLASAGIGGNFLAGPCYGMDFATPADLIIVGVFYQAQPDLLKCKGQAMAASLAGGGVLMVQSSKPENPFITELMLDDSERHAAWPWYEEGFSIRKHIPYAGRVDVADETMLIASDDPARVGQLTNVLRADQSGSPQEV